VRSELFCAEPDSRCGVLLQVSRVHKDKCVLVAAQHPSIAVPHQGHIVQRGRVALAGSLVRLVGIALEALQTRCCARPPGTGARSGRRVATRVRAKPAHTARQLLAPGFPTRLPPASYVPLEAIARVPVLLPQLLAVG
jgi:hypothetical protein